MSVDDQLMPAQTAPNQDNQPENSSNKSGDLREAQRGGATDQETGESDWREQIMASRKEQAVKLSAGAADSEKSQSFGTSKFLQAAWRNLIPSFGFSFFYVYIHIFGYYVLGKLFAWPGLEWFDKPGISVKERDEKGKNIKLRENFAILVITVILLIVIIVSFSIPALIIDVVSNPLRLGVVLLNSFYSWLSGG